MTASVLFPTVQPGAAVFPGIQPVEASDRRRDLRLSIARIVRSGF